MTESKPTWQQQSENRAAACLAACAALVPPLTIESERIAKRYGLNASEWDATACHFAVTLRRGPRSFTLEYSMGSGHRVWKRKAFGPFSDPPAGLFTGCGEPSKFLNGRVHADTRAWVIANSEAPPPTLPEIIDCLASDCTVLEQTFEDWCGDMGADPDSRKAEATYRACDEQAKRMLAVLSVDEVRRLADIYNGNE